jgi:signal transduction histidine kinase/CheY-like chemotaxis protein
LDWTKTALGPVSQWPQSLRTSVGLCLSSTFPILIAWGPELIQIYNDSYRPICGAKHPGSMGQNFKICWETALPVVGDAFDRGLGGEGTYIKDQQMLLDRHGYIEEAFMTFSFAPIRDESGQVVGIFHPITETTDQILSARRTQVLRDLAVQTANAKTMDEIYETLTPIHNSFAYDVPFLQIYELDENAEYALLRSSAGISGGFSDFDKIRINEDNGSPWPFRIGEESMWPVQIDQLSERLGNFKSGPFEEPPQTALIFPVAIAGHQKPFGFLVVGVSSARSLDQAYRNFFELFANTISTAFSNVDAYLQQQNRAKQLAEIDRAKTAFFSNVSHEFRTPLTLILGPLQQLADHPELGGTLSAVNRESMYRNAQRLLKLVNNLLDFSRMEAGRVKASYQNVWLGSLTADLASNFRSVIESAGMQLLVDITEPDTEVYVDPDMWEKIVLNLLSNAFKYTLRGSITVQVKEEGDFVILNVTDTGIGIPESELPHMFERFHRVENALGRTHEGTGIGLSLISELVNLHHGQISVTSVFGKGSTFSVRIPMGKNHLDSSEVTEVVKIPKGTSLRETFIREAMSLLGHTDLQEEAMRDDGLFEPVLGKSENGHVLIVDDNADMRAYMARLLSPYFSIDVAVNGQDALDKVLQHTPDAIVSDVMMPVMDGQQFLQKLRSMPGARIPVVLLSARAGEESRLEGLSWGADDYLVKPFSAKELVSKVNALVKIGNLTRKTESELRNIFFQAPVAIGIFRGTLQVIEVANKMMLRYWGKTSEEVIGMPFAQVFKESRKDGFDVIAREVFQTGQRRMLQNWPLDIVRHGKPAKLYISLVMEPGEL